jgi:hypothetical protein
MACCVLGNKAITIQELSVYFSEVTTESENRNMDKGTTQGKDETEESHANIDFHGRPTESPW